MTRPAYRLEEIPGSPPRGLPDGWAETPSGLWAPIPADVTAQERPAELLACDLFSGCGGFSLGLHAAGIDVVVATDSSADAATTYVLNLGRPDCRIAFTDDAGRAAWERATRSLADGWMGSGYRASTIANGGDPEWPRGLGTERPLAGGCRGYIIGDVRKITGQMLLEVAGVDGIDVVVGGPPCQGLSRANARACLEDPRNGLLWEYLRIVQELAPAYFVIENVPQILTIAGGALFEGLASIANQAGYSVHANTLDACNYGVPQYRKRAFIVGVQRGRPAYQFPTPTHWPLIRGVDGDDTTMRFPQEDGARVEARQKAARSIRYDADTGRWEIDEETASVAADSTGQPDLFAAVEASK